MKMNNPETSRQAVETVKRALQATSSLRSRLRTEYAAAPSAGVPEYLSQLDQAIAQIERPGSLKSVPAVDQAVRQLQDARQQLADAAFEKGDNVLCMDELHYRIFPTLKKILKVLDR